MLNLESLQLNDDFRAGVLPMLGLEPRTIGQQTSALTVRPFNASIVELPYRIPSNPPSPIFH